MCMVRTYSIYGMGSVVVQIQPNFVISVLKWVHQNGQLQFNRRWQLKKKKQGIQRLLKWLEYNDVSHI